MSLLYALDNSFIGKTIGAAANTVLNPLVTGGLLAFLEKAPEHTVQDLLQRASLPADFDLTYVKLALAALAAAGLIRSTNRKLSSMASNAWRLGGAPGWDWPREVAVVTGGSSGIGLAITQKLLEKGIKVAIFDLQPLPKELERNNNVRYYKCDVTSSASLSEAASGVRRDFGAPSILVNNAGIAVPTTILDMDEKKLQKIFGVNTMCHWLTVKEFLPAMIKKNKGHIVTVASVASFVAMPGHADYGCTKASALAFHEALGAEIKHIYGAPNILTTIVHPNFVATPLLTDMKSHLNSSGIRFLTPERVADDTCRQVFDRKGGQVIVPKTSSAASAVRGWPLWIQVTIHNFMALNTKKMLNK